ncbi:MAG: TolC family outer membrane protein [Endozoicomonas sp.]
MNGKVLQVFALSAITLAASVRGSLIDSVNETLATNPEILIRTTEARARLDEIRQARGGYFPKVDLTAGIGYENSRNGTTLGAYNRGESDSKTQDRTRREASLTGTQMLFDGFATDSEVDRQTARQLSATMEVCRAAESVAIETTEAYINILRQQQLFEVATSNRNEHERIYDLINKQGISGLISDADLVQAQSRLVLAQANQIATESALRDSKTVYQRLVGNLPEDMQLPNTPGNIPVDLEQALDTAATSHPVLKVAQADIKAAEAQYEASKSSFMPKFELELAATWGRDQNGGKRDEYDHTAMLKMRYNLLNGGADKARLEQTSKLLTEAMEVRDRAARQVREEVRFAWTAVEFGEKRLVPLATHVEHALRSRDLRSSQFNLGRRTLIDLLDSQNEYFAARQAEVNALHDLLFNQYRLHQSTGSLLSYLQAKLPEGFSCDV